MVNISRVTVNCFPFDVIVFATLPAHDVWWETVSCDHGLANEWLHCSRKNPGYITKIKIVVVVYMCHPVIVSGSHLVKVVNKYSNDTFLAIILSDAFDT